MYVVAPNIGGYHLYPDSETLIDAGGGQSRNRCAEQVPGTTLSTAGM
jgi:hypothetical protein